MAFNATVTNSESSLDSNIRTPGLSHLRTLRLLDRTGLSHWLLGFGCFLSLTIVAFIMLISISAPDPDIYRNTVAFVAIVSFLLTFYFASGRGWYADMLQFLNFDDSLEPHLDVINPTRLWILIELVVAAVCTAINIQLNDQIDLDYSPVLFGSVVSFYYIQWVLIVFIVDIVLRQYVCLMRISRHVRIDLLDSEFYSNLANVMVRHVGLTIYGVCIISMSYIVFTDGELSATEMMVLLMPWYLPGVFIISLYLVPYNIFRKRVRSNKLQELSSVTAAIGGNREALQHSLLKDEDEPGIIDLLYYQDRVNGVKEWPFTDRIRALVLFGILPPLTWVIAALIEIMIEGAI